MVSELSPQLWGRHWEMTGEDTDLKEGKEDHQSRKRSHLLFSVSMGTNLDCKGRG